jgi:hypothetical protein
MLGSVTEVALFTDRVEVTKIDASEEDVEKRLRLRLSKFLSPADGAAVTDVTPVSEPAPFVIPEASNEGEGMTLDAEIGIVAERRNA